MKKRYSSTKKDLSYGEVKETIWKYSKKCRIADGYQFYYYYGLKN